MSSPITPPQGPFAAQPVRPTDAARSSMAPPSTGAPFALEPTVSLNSLHASPSPLPLPASPPREVLEEMASAAQTYEALSSQGRELRFERDEQSGRTKIEVRDRSGNVLKTLSPAQALALAAGTPLE